MEVLILGCGGSNGVPEIGCDCYVCSSTYVKNERTRSSIIVRNGDTAVLIDSGPDLRQQALKCELKQYSIDGVIYTHSHSDHVCGVDDLKLLLNKRPAQAYMDSLCGEEMLTRFDYIFKPRSQLYQPIMSQNIVEHGVSFQIGSIAFTTAKQLHHNCISMSVMFGNIGYSVDFSMLPQETIDMLFGIDVWIVDCLRYFWAPSHQYFELLLDYLDKIQPKLAILTHMNHNIDYDEIAAILPSNVIPAYDGMLIQANHPHVIEKTNAIVK